MTTVEPSTIFTQLNVKFSSRPAPEDLILKVANGDDTEGVAIINSMCQGTPLGDIVPMIQKHLSSLDCNPKQNVFVATLVGQVVGFSKCRYHDGASSSFPSPRGWYGTGIEVHPEFRRRNIASSLSLFRLNWLRAETDGVFSFVSSENEASLRMHEKWGFKIIDEGPGFLNVSFRSGKGFLFYKKIS